MTTMTDVSPGLYNKQTRAGGQWERREGTSGKTPGLRRPQKGRRRLCRALAGSRGAGERSSGLTILSMGTPQGRKPANKNPMKKNRNGMRDNYKSCDMHETGIPRKKEKETEEILYLK